MQAGDSCSFRRSDGNICNGIIESIKKDSVIVKFNSRHDPNKFGLKKVHMRRLFVEIKEENDYSIHQHQSVYDYCLYSDTKKVGDNQLIPVINSEDTVNTKLSVNTENVMKIVENNFNKRDTNSFNHFKWILFLLFIIMFGCMFYLLHDHYKYLKAVSN